MNNGDMPANPITNHELAISINKGSSSFGGFTKREMIAMHAMQGLLSSESEKHWYSIPENCARAAVNYADALLKELEK